jgi:2,4-dienoyl-CoA reductase-like NADH-dependent reductase (Old Yellow Enzyme family)
MLVLEPKEIGGMIVKNRLIRSATGEGMATRDGGVTDRLVELYENLAKGGVGLIITGITYSQPNYKYFPGQTGVYKDELIPGLRKITESVHKHGNGCKIAVQLGHCGRQSFLSIGASGKLVAPSAVYEPVIRNMPREMAIEEIEETIGAFGEAARRAMEAGFDAVQLHAAHGYLLSEFLSSYTNRRTDEYGGSTENRAKFILDIYDEIIKETDKDFPVLIKMNVDDLVDGGLKIDESKKFAEKFSKTGFAAIETSGCMWETPIHHKGIRGILPEARIGVRPKDQEAFFLPYAREIKKVIDVPLILVGGIRSLDVAEKILGEGSADFISLCRPLIREPDLPNKWLAGTKITADCISCNRCVVGIGMGGVRCGKKERR